MEHAPPASIAAKGSFSVSGTAPVRPRFPAALPCAKPPAHPVCQGGPEHVPERLTADRRQLDRVRRRPHPDRAQPRHRRAGRHRCARGPARPRPSAESRRQRLPRLAQGVGFRPLEADAQGGGPAAGARRRHRPHHDDGARQAAGGVERRDAGGRRRDRLVRGGSPPHLWPRGAGARREHLPARDQGAGGSSRRVHPVEFPDQPGGAQTLLRFGCRVLYHRQGAGGDAGLARRTDPLLRRCRGAGRRGEPGLWRAGRDLRVPSFRIR